MYEFDIQVCIYTVNCLYLMLVSMIFLLSDILVSWRTVHEQDQAFPQKIVLGQRLTRGRMNTQDSKVHAKEHNCNSFSL